MVPVHVVEEEYGIGSFEVGSGKRLVSFLPGCIEDVELDCELIDLAFLDGEIDAACGPGFGIELAVDILSNETRLANTSMRSHVPESPSKITLKLKGTYVKFPLIINLACASINYLQSL
jgi:hypothetical protein